MSESTDVPEPVAEKPNYRAANVPTIIRWAARLTSVPMFAILLLSLVPALAHFSVSARDDRIIALGLCGVAAGFVAGWRWPGIGGVLALISLGVIVSQEDDSIAADPFVIGFALQAIVFLISYVVTPTAAQVGRELKLVWLRRVAACLLIGSAALGAAILCRAPSAIPLPRNRDSFVGVWENGNGFRIAISNQGLAKVSEDPNAKVPDWNTPVAPGTSGDFVAEFRDDQLQLSGGVLGRSKTYHIDRAPFRQGKVIRMVLNGSDPYEKSGGMVLEKKEPSVAAPTKGKS